MQEIFSGCLVAIIVWRVFSSLEPVDYNKIRDIIKKELKDLKESSQTHRTKNKERVN